MERNEGGGRTVFFDHFRDFCDRTSLHGWTFCFRQEKPFSHTIGWLFVIALSMISIGVLMANSISEFTAATVSFNLESPTVTLDQIYFPSIAICNVNSLRRSFVYHLLSDHSLQNVSFYELQKVIDSYILGSTDTYSNEEVVSIMNRVFNSSKFNEMFDEYLDSSLANTSSFGNVPIARFHPLVEADRSPQNREKLKRESLVDMATQWRDGEMVVRANFPGWGMYYSPGFSTDISQTCVWLSPFVKEPSDPQLLWTMQKAASNGVNNGLQLLLDAESFDYSTSQSANEGFTVSVLHPLDIPVMKHTGIDIDTGQAVKIAVVPDLVETTKACKSRFIPKKRQCYFEEEIMLRHFPHNYSYRYEMSNCLYEATMQKVEKECNCTQFMFLQIVKGYQACKGVAANCMANLTNAMGSIRMIDDRGQEKEFLAACTDQKHSFLLSKSVFPNLESFHRRPEFCIVLDKLKNSCGGDRRQSLDDHQPKLCPILNVIMVNNYTCEAIQRSNNISKTLVEVMRREVGKYARENMVTLVVYIRDPYLKKYIREEKITQINFVGTIGGILGLFSGFSFISAIEVIYYLLFFGVSGASGKRRKHVTKSQQQQKKVASTRQAREKW